MKAHKKLTALAIFTVLSGLHQTTQAWMETLQALQHPENGQVVRLASDIHADYEAKIDKKAWDIESEFIDQVKEPLVDLFDVKNQDKELFIVEVGFDKLDNDVSIQSTPEVIKAMDDTNALQEKQKKLLNDIAFKSLSYNSTLFEKFLSSNIPLMGRLNLLKDSRVTYDTKNALKSLCGFPFYDTLNLVAYDIRSESGSILIDSILKGRTRDEVLKKQLWFEQSDTDYLVTKIKNIRDFKSYNKIVEKGLRAKAEDLLSKFYNQEDCNIFDVYLTDYADLGYLAYIAKNFDSGKNITLYLGADHCDNLAEDLQKMGFKTIFEAGNFSRPLHKDDSIPMPLSKKEYQDFFATGRFKKN